MCLLIVAALAIESSAGWWKNKDDPSWTPPAQSGDARKKPPEEPYDRPIRARPSAASPAVGALRAPAAPDKKWDVASDDPFLFYRTLMEKRIATMEDLVSCAARFDRPAAEPSGFDRTIDFLNTVGWSIGRGSIGDRQAPVTKGAAARLFLSRMGRSESLARAIFPSSLRYAFREAVQLGLFPGRDHHPNDILSGSDLFAFFSTMVNRSIPDDRAPSKGRPASSVRNMKNRDRQPPAMEFPASGRLRIVRGGVHLFKDGRWRAVEPGDGEVTVERGDEVAVDIDGRARMEFASHTVEVFPLTQVTLTQAKMGNNRWSFEYDLHFGRVEVDVRQSPGRIVQCWVVTPAVISGITGSVLDAGHIPGFGSVMRMSEGHGFVVPFDPGRLSPEVKPVPSGGSAGGASVMEQFIRSAGDRWIDAAVQIGQGESLAVPEAGRWAARQSPGEFLRTRSVTDIVPVGTPLEEADLARLAPEALDEPPQEIGRSEQEKETFRSNTAAATASASESFVSSRRPPLPP